MAETKKQKKIGGPYLAAAVLCSSVSEDSDGVLSVIRIVDEIRLIAPSNSPEFPSKDEPLDISIFALIMIRRGDATAGKHKFSLVIEQPNGKRKELFKQDLEMPQHPNGTANVKARLVMKLHSPGTFWIDVVLDRRRLTRMALNLVIQRSEVPRKEVPQ